MRIDDTFRMGLANLLATAEAKDRYEMADYLIECCREWEREDAVRDGTVYFRLQNGEFGCIGPDRLKLLPQSSGSGS